MLSRLTTLRPSIRFRAFNCKYTTRPSHEAGDDSKVDWRRGNKPNGDSRRPSHGDRNSSKADWRSGGKQKNAAAENIKNLVAQWQSEGDRYVSYENLAKLDSELAQFTADRTIQEKAHLLSELTLTYFARSYIDLSRNETTFKPDNLVHTTGFQNILTF
jgi:hypothetical protein